MRFDRSLRGPLGQGHRFIELIGTGVPLPPVNPAGEGEGSPAALPPGFDPYCHTLFIGPNGSGKTGGLTAAVNLHGNPELYLASGRPFQTWTEAAPTHGPVPAAAAHSPREAVGLITATVEVAQARHQCIESVAAAEHCLLLAIDGFPSALDLAAVDEQTVVDLENVLMFGQYLRCLVYATAVQSSAVPWRLRRYFQIVETRYPHPPSRNGPEEGYFRPG